MAQYFQYDEDAIAYLRAKDAKLAAAIDAVEHMNDAEAIAALSSLKGIGEWTAEMLLLFSLNRMDILSFGDLGIHRGMRMVYHHREVTRALFEKYRRRFSPYGSVASLYFWAISKMDVPGYDRDYAPKKKNASKKRVKRAGKQQRRPKTTTKAD